jgi:hypothetical protein
VATARSRPKGKKGERMLPKIGFGCCLGSSNTTVVDHDHRDIPPARPDIELITPEPKVNWVARLYKLAGIKQPKILPWNDYERTYQYFRNPRTNSWIKADTYVVKIVDTGYVFIPEVSTYQYQKELIEKYQDYETGIVFYLSSRDALDAPAKVKIEIPESWYLAVNRWQTKRFQPDPYIVDPQHMLWKHVPSIQDYIDQRVF